MKKITKFFLMLVVVMMSSGVLLAQLQISDLEKQMMQNFQPKELGDGSGGALPLNVDAATPITVFPYEEDFESGTWSPYMEPFSGLQADATVASGEGNNSTYAALLEGNSWSGFYHTSSCTYTMLYNRPLHEAGINMTVVPSGEAGLLTMRFDYDQFYSFAYYYDAFQVLVNGTPIPDESGTTCFYPTSNNGNGYSTLTFDLGAYQNDASFDLQIDFVGKYYRNYYNGGDAMVIDNLTIFYLQIGDISVDVTADGAPLAGATVGIEDVNEYVTDATGHVDFIGLEIGDYEVYAYKDGMNYATQTATVVTGGVTQVDFNLSPPVMVINPLAIVETLNPNEWFTTYIGIQNIGDGDLFWTAEVV
ncbi:MAG: carboxypeptidase-like regulatory domain-containing protein, partial [Bacteroidales bacterium]|nr:carboxypeptidase-like regulatory domain-containing protein [Bacteroidales bacterium]